MNTNRIAEFEESDDALRFCKLKGEDYTVCAGINLMWAVRPKSRREIEEPGSVDVDGDDEL
jgi:hypothetical protein